jgi:hypothetical protein
VRDGCPVPLSPKENEEWVGCGGAVDVSLLDLRAHTYSAGVWAVGGAAGGGRLRTAKVT